MIERGRLVERISLLRPTVINDHGTPVAGDPETIQARIAAEVLAATPSRMTLFASQVQEQTNYIVRTYRGYSWRIEKDDYLVWHDGVQGDRILRIVGHTIPDIERRELVMACEERQL